MNERFDEIDKSIRAVEKERLLRKLEESEREPEAGGEKPPAAAASDGYYEILGAVTVGITMGVITMLFNFLVFTWSLHLDLNLP